MQSENKRYNYRDVNIMIEFRRFELGRQCLPNCLTGIR